MSGTVSVKYPKYVPLLLALATLAMVAANLFGAGIPWLIVFLPILIQLGVLALSFAIMGVLAVAIVRLKAKADKK
jgi:hypothetical protein